MADTVNFPEHLDISPSITPKQFASTSNDSSGPTIFGHAAQRDAIDRYGIAGRVWEAAYALSLYVHPPPNLEFDPPFMRQKSSKRQRAFLELGAGTGIVSSRIAEVLGTGQDLLIATDLPEVCPLLESNLRLFFQEAKSSSNVVVRPLAWGKTEHSMLIASDLLSTADPTDNSTMLSNIICSDLVYFPELLAPLLRTLLQLTSPPFSLSAMDADTVTVIISYKIRSLSKETPFWSAFGLWFEYEPVLVRDRALESRWQRFGTLSPDDTTFVFTAHRRAASFSWDIPIDDRDLLLGRGAGGDNKVKEDETFEMLLLMTMNNDSESDV